MKKISQKKHFYFFVALVLIVVIGVYLQNFNNKQTVSDECVLVDNKCEVLKEDLTLSLEFGQTPIPEEEITLDISISDAYFISNAWVEGVNMYMGKSPIVFENSSKPTQGLMFLGSCNLDQMQWHLHLLVTKKGTATEIQFVVPFVTNNG